MLTFCYILVVISSLEQLALRKAAIIKMSCLSYLNVCVLKWTLFSLLKVNKTSHVMTRKDLGDNIMEITHKQGVDHWLVIKKQLDASKVNILVSHCQLSFVS